MTSCRRGTGRSNKLSVGPNPLDRLIADERHVCKVHLCHVATMFGLFHEGNGIVNLLVLVQVNAVINTKSTRTGEVCNQSPATVFLWNNTYSGALESWQKGFVVRARHVTAFAF